MFVALGAAMGAVACSKLFGDAVQCSSDGDCAGFGAAICDVAQGVCSGSADGGPPRPTPIGDGQIGGDDGSREGSVGEGSAGDAGADPCFATTKPQITLSGEAGPPLADGGAPTVEIRQDLVLSCANDYVLKGDVVVRSGATLTIAKGTTIKGDKVTRGALYVMPGAKLNAVGTSDAPIIFTSAEPMASRLPDDWGGIIVLGSAGPAASLDGNPQLGYGGGAADNGSGSLSYLRVEYSGSPLVFAGAASTTFVNYVQVRHPLAGCFRFRGGGVNVKHLACQAPRSEAFDFGAGYAAKAQFLVAQGRAPADNHEALLIDASSLTAYNVTLCGSSEAHIGYGLSPRGGTKMHLSNFIVTGFSAGLVVYAPMGTPFDLVSTIFYGNSENVAYAKNPMVTDMGSPYFDHANGFDENAWFNGVTHRNSQQSPGIGRCLAFPPVFGPSEAITALAEVTPSDSFFESAPYVGAVRDVNDGWATGAWTNWKDP